ncbi:hypothetical protein ACFO4N_03340 [Camelliibacillus cellulosilyticus]|uniref:Uncharacterized protein n=1 Tax=Camelliibacillus cellulosilyticus TaxID=2174486 RepID=A0ABV9GIN9_9BACL
MKFTSRLCACLVISICIFCLSGKEAHLFDPSSDVYESQPVPLLSTLIRTSDAILYGSVGSVIQEYHTGKRVRNGELVNTLQKIQVLQSFKGRATRPIELITTGVEPMPRPSDPLNQRFPGALAEGQYIFFLKKIPGSSLYQLNGGPQGFYPLINGRTISLYGTGFQTLNQRTVAEFWRVLHAFQ